MIDIEYIRSFFPPTIARESRFDRYMLKEYLQLLILDHLACRREYQQNGILLWGSGTSYRCALCDEVRRHLGSSERA